MKYGDVEFDDLVKMRDNLKQLEKDMNSELFMDMSKLIARTLLNAVRDKTPTISGNLKRSWAVKVEKRGSEYIIFVKNIMHYASYFEYGHRTVNGGWKEGAFVLKLSMDDTLRISEPKLRKMIEEKIARCFNA